MTRIRRKWHPAGYQLFVYLRYVHGYEYAFIAEVVNREFETDYTKHRLRFAYDKFLASGKVVKTDLIQEYTL